MSKNGTSAPQYDEVFTMKTDANMQEIVTQKEPPTMNYMNQTIRSQLRGTATSKTFRYQQESPNKTSGGKTTPATPGGGETMDQTPTKISKLDDYD